MVSYFGVAQCDRDRFISPGTRPDPQGLKGFKVGCSTVSRLQADSPPFTLADLGVGPVPSATPVFQLARCGVINAIAKQMSVSEVRTVAIRRPGCTASRGVPSSGPIAAAA